MAYEVALPRVKSALDDFLATLRQQLRKDLPIYAIIVPYVIFGAGLALLTGNWTQATFTPYFERWPKLFLMILPIIALGFDAARVFIRLNHHRWMGFARVYTAERFARLVAGMILLMAFMFFQGAFTTLKNMLPVLNGGFPHDVLHADIDQWMHFGMAPSTVMHRWFGQGFMRDVIDWNYNVLWFVFCFVGLFYVATVKRCESFRLRYMLLFILTWILLGNIIAGLFLSAGPAFYAEVTGDHQRFAALMTALSGDEPTVAFRYQQTLWRYYIQGTAGFASGISAFPSVHVGLITTNALFLAERMAKWRYLAAAYVAFIVISSVYLGWHYAIDGYVAIAVVVLFYTMFRKWFGDPMPSTIRLRTH